jgi:hypothetical protein
MIHADRFVETSENYEAWLEARRGGVTATEVAKAATTAGLKEALAERANPTPVEVNAYMQFGSDNEDWIARVLKRDFDLMPNRWLIAADGVPQHMATPDALSLDHEWIGEIKTGGKTPLNKDGLLIPPIAHRRQIQWQLHCTGARSCVYAFMLRAEVDGAFVPAWLEPQIVIVPRDEEMIADLVRVADQLLIDFEGWEAA